MDRRGHKLKFTAVAAFVVLALTGFSTGRGHGSSSHSGGDGGGCSSSSQNHDSSSSSSGGSSYRDYDDDDDTYGGSGGSSNASTTLQDATVKLVDCATPTTPYATVEVTNPNSSGGYFTVTVDFLDADAERVEQGTADEYIGANETETVQVDLSSPGVAAKVDHCEPQTSAPAG
ncbi:hypothetical protein [Streptomyces sp. NPDC050263]|uniref:hypothetical protein n=1 Tax=Streptomyces sp. NPDC050263 TaxID=3155037 RepID=UPI0034339878